MGNRFVHSACLMVWLAAIAGGGAADIAWFEMGLLEPGD